MKTSEKVTNYESASVEFYNSISSILQTEKAVKRWALDVKIDALQLDATTLDRWPREHA